MASILATKIQLRNDIRTNWEQYNPVLLRGEVGIELDTNRLKVGDGVKTWSQLDYIAGSTDTTTLIEQLEQSLLGLGGGTLTGDLVLADGSKAASESVVDAKIAAALDNAVLSREIVDELPSDEDAVEGKLYMVAATDGTANDIYNEYMYINGAFERIGSTAVDVSNFMPKVENPVAGAIPVFNADGTIGSSTTLLDAVKTLTINSMAIPVENGTPNLKFSTEFSYANGEVSLAAVSVEKLLGELTLNGGTANF